MGKVTITSFYPIGLRVVSVVSFPLSNQLIDQSQSLFRGGDCPFKLSFADRVEQGLEDGSRFQPMPIQVVTGQKRRRIEYVRGPFPQTLLAEIHVVFASAAGARIGPMQGQ